MAMSTPISNLPPVAAPSQGGSGGDEDDPLLNDILKDVESKIRAEQSQQHTAAHQPQQPQPYIMQPVHIPVHNVPHHPHIGSKAATASNGSSGSSGTKRSKLINIEYLKWAACAAVLAAVIFSEAFMTFVMTNAPSMVRPFIEPYSFLLKIVLLFVVLYVLLYFYL
jgi:hypothetical protein